MKLITFDITGNHKSKTGNPVGYKRLLSNHHRAVDKDYREYQKLFLTLTRSQNLRIHALPLQLAKGEQCDLDIQVHWENEKHGDLDNIVKMVLDTLLINDKEVREIRAEAFHGTEGKLLGKIAIY